MVTNERLEVNTPKTELWTTFLATKSGEITAAEGVCEHFFVKEKGFPN